MGKFRGSHDRKLQEIPAFCTSSSQGRQMISNFFLFADTLKY